MHRSDSTPLLSASHASYSSNVLDKIIDDDVDIERGLTHQHRDPAKNAGDKSDDAFRRISVDRYMREAEKMIIHNTTALEADNIKELDDAIALLVLEHNALLGIAKYLPQALSIPGFLVMLGSMGLAFGYFASVDSYVEGLLDELSKVPDKSDLHQYNQYCSAFPVKTPKRLCNPWYYTADTKPIDVDGWEFYNCRDYATHFCWLYSHDVGFRQIYTTSLGLESVLIEIIGPLVIALLMMLMFIIAKKLYSSTCYRDLSQSTQTYVDNIILNKTSLGVNPNATTISAINWLKYERDTQFKIYQDNIRARTEADRNQTFHSLSNNPSYLFALKHGASKRGRAILPAGNDVMTLIDHYLNDGPIVKIEPRVSTLSFLKETISPHNNVYEQIKSCFHKK